VSIWRRRRISIQIWRERGINLTGEIMPARWMRILGNYTRDDSRVVTSPNASDPALLPGNHLCAARSIRDLFLCLPPGKALPEFRRLLQRTSAPTVTFCSWGCRRERQDMRDSICP